MDSPLVVLVTRWPCEPQSIRIVYSLRHQLLPAGTCVEFYFTSYTKKKRKVRILTEPRQGVKKGVQSKCPKKSKTSQVICQNVPSIFSAYWIKIEIENIFCKHTGQNIPKSKRSKSKRPRVKTSQCEYFKFWTTYVLKSNVQCAEVTTARLTIALQVS